MDMMNLEEVFDIFKNISSSISHKKTLRPLDLSFFLAHSIMKRFDKNVYEC